MREIKYQEIFKIVEDFDAQAKLESESERQIIDRSRNLAICFCGLVLLKGFQMLEEQLCRIGKGQDKRDV